MMNEILIAGKKTTFIRRGESGPIVFWGMYPHQGNELEHMEECLLQSNISQDFTLLAFPVEDWNRDFSPWEAPAAFGDESFSGNGPDTLSWLTDEAIPYMKACFPKSVDVYLLGYSLAGLFALWATYKTDQLTGVACCSGSLWYPDWDKFVSGNSVKSVCNIYLSLGGKEEKTSNKIMATVGDRTRSQEKLLKKDTNVKAVTLEWNSGGHFADAQKRLVKGICWLLAQRYEVEFF